MKGSFASTISDEATLLHKDSALQTNKKSKKKAEANAEANAAARSKARPEAIGTERRRTV